MRGAWRKAASMAQLAQLGAVSVAIGERQIGLFLIEGQVYAIDNLCTHGNARLTEGVVEGYLIECPLHAGLVDLRSGHAAGAPITRDSRTYPVKVEHDHVFLQIAETET